MIAIRLAVLVLAGWCIALLPREDRNSDVACAPSRITTIEAQPSANMVGSHVVDTALDDMLLHD
ncbi:hypothetical protein [Bradyrhizobium sp. F1.4.3]|uniref:hypothetical protein n=1 Tax=Bradyrhizobium sp. F1.4.3 TaxID=3156356 RepID=UPI0033959BAC